MFLIVVILLTQQPLSVTLHQEAQKNGFSDLSCQFCSSSSSQTLLFGNSHCAMIMKEAFWSF